MRHDGATQPTRWKGHYTNVFDTASGHFGDEQDHTFPISATLSGLVGRFSGEMADVVTVRSYLYSDYVNSEAGSRLSPNEQAMAERLLKAYPETRMESTLPANSNLAGKWTGNKIEFTKTYLESVSSRWIFDQTTTQEAVSPARPVIYRGELSAEGDRIVGTWHIPKRGIAGIFGAKQGEGTFVLVRDDT